MLLRIDRLENQVRQLTGQIEQMQFTTRKLEEQLKKFQEDVEFRFQESHGQGGAAPAPATKSLQRRSEAEEPAVDSIDEPVSGVTEPDEFRGSKGRMRRGDAFDPASDPTAPGAPRTLGSLGSTQPSGPVARLPGSAQPRSAQPRSANPALDGRDPDAPLDLSGSKLGASERASASSSPPFAAVQPGPSAGSGSETAITPARFSSDPVREQFDLALGLLKQKEYENAEKSFAAFLQKNPKSKLASDALFYLGESYFQRGRQREAAEQYLKVSTSYASSPRAPNAFLRLGQSLNALGAKEQACAAYAEIGRKYPNASASLKSDVEREARRARC
jgi:tol-pal system protein YbgF